MNCKTCGAELSQDDMICPSCGDTVINDEVLNEEVSTSVNADEIEESDIVSSDFDDDNISYVDEDSDIDMAFDIQDTGEQEKPNKIFKLVAIALACILVATAGVAAYFQFFKPNVPNPILSVFGIDTSDKKPIVYTKLVDGKSNVYVKPYGGTEVMLKTLADANDKFAPYSTYISGSDNTYYIDGTSLFVLPTGKKTPIKISDNAVAGSMIISADEDNLLFLQQVDEKTKDLYLYTKGKTAKKVETLLADKTPEQAPTYGFADKTNNIWFIKLPQSPAPTSGEESVPVAPVNGEMFIKTGNTTAKSVLTDVGSVIYCDEKGENIISTKKQADSAVLQLNEKGKEPIILNDKFSGTDAPVIVNTPKKGVVFVGDVELPTGEAAAMSMPTGTLYYQPFGGEKISLDTGVGAVIKASQMMGMKNAALDYTVYNDTDDTILYIKGQDVLISKNCTVGSKPEGFDYFSSNPTFSKDFNTVLFLEKAADAAAQQPVEGAPAPQPKMTLKLSTYEKGAWTAPKVIAENAAQCTISADSSQVAYFTLKENDPQNAILSLYNVKSGQIQQLTESAIGTCYFSTDSSCLYFTSDFKTDSNSATLNSYKIGGKTEVLDASINGFTMSETFVPYGIKSEGPNQQAFDLYTINKNNKLEIISNGVQNINSY